MDFKTIAAFTLLGLVATALVIGLIIVFIVEPSTMIPVAFVGLFVAICWAGIVVSEYLEDREGF